MIEALSTQGITFNSKSATELSSFAEKNANVWARVISNAKELGADKKEQQSFFFPIPIKSFPLFQVLLRVIAPANIVVLMIAYYVIMNFLIP